MIPNMDTTPVGEEVRRARTTLGLTLVELSERTALFNGGEKIPMRTIHGIETGESRYPTERILRPLGDALEPESSYRLLALKVYRLESVPA